VPQERRVVLKENRESNSWVAIIRGLEMPAVKKKNKQEEGAGMEDHFKTRTVPPPLGSVQLSSALLSLSLSLSLSNIYFIRMLISCPFL
jgi:hypothetical protein